MNILNDLEINECYNLSLEKYDVATISKRSNEEIWVSFYNFEPESGHIMLFNDLSKNMQNEILKQLEIRKENLNA